jgi:riboflavin kinase/FMN adenylyltransferase
MTLCYLGYDYYLTGTVFKGKQLGRTIGFPTANIQRRL